MKQISILGCGWLGLPLGEHLAASGFAVNGSVTGPAKFRQLMAAGINPYVIKLPYDVYYLPRFLESSGALIIDIPPKLRGESSENFTGKIKQLIPFIEESGIQKVIFISSTSVYADDNNTVTEETLPKPQTESGRQLLECEQLLQQNPNFKTTVIRFGGLIGEDRHPVYSLSGKTGLENPKAPVNLIHQKDCIEIISTIIEKDIWGETFNAVAPYHPSRQEYYSHKAKQLGLNLPDFNSGNLSVGKIINSDKLMDILDYRFKENTL